MPFLTPHSAVAYLLRHGLITSEAVVDADLSVEGVAQRNSNFKVTRKHGPGYLLKQGLDEERAETLEREALVYSRIRQASEAYALRPHTVRCHRYDASEHLLALEFARDAQDLRHYHSQPRRFSTSHARSMAKVLRAVHRLKPEFLAGVKAAPLDAPWVLAVHHPVPAVIRSISGGNVELIGIIQQTEGFGELLDQLRREWKPSAFIHADVRWGNWLLSRASRTTKLKIVDWELAGIGDPGWDIGATISEYLSWWLITVPETTMESLESIPAPALSTLRAMQAALRSFWRHYCLGMKLDGEERRDVLILAMRYCGARLVQTAYEQLQFSWRMNAQALQLLQLGFNILNRPQDAILRLGGIDADTSRGS